MIAFELVRDPATGEPWTDMLTPFVLACEALSVHVTYTYYEGAIRIIPPLNISKEEMDFAIAAFDRVLSELESGKLQANRNEQQNPAIKRILDRNPLRKTLNRMWETSPKYWASKLRGPR